MIMPDDLAVVLGLNHQKEKGKEKRKRKKRVLVSFI